MFVVDVDDDDVDVVDPEDEGESAPECDLCGSAVVEDEGGESCAEVWGPEVNRTVAMCASCREDHSSCDDCGLLVESDDLTLVRGANGDVWSVVCPDHRDSYSECDRCAGVFVDSAVRTVDPGSWSARTYCDQCSDDVGVWFCEDCGEHVDEDHEGHDEDDDDDADVHSYCYKPDPLFFSGECGSGLLSAPAPSVGRPFLGFELECEIGRGQFAAAARFVESQWGRFTYLKDDGSLTHGFEIVSHPLDESAVRVVDWSVLGSLTERFDARAWQTTTCGLHVHVSRDAFTAAHLARFLLLIYRNQAHVERFAGRSSDRWASFKGERPRVFSYAKGEAVNPCRYVAVNLHNEHTVELRVFRGSTNADTVRAVLEFVFAAFSYTQTLTGRDAFHGGFEWGAFVEWVGARTDRFPHLAACPRFVAPILGGV